jgi:hypothetical protein
MPPPASAGRTISTTRAAPTSWWTPWNRDSAWSEGCLAQWTPDMLADQIRRDYLGERQVHTRSSILQRLFTHEAYHCGELSQTLGIHGLPQIDLWRPD